MTLHPRAAAALRLAFFALAGAWLVAHIAAIFTENINWDEFALLQRVERMAATGQVQGGGRPGAIEVLLLPIVRGCEDAITTVRSARLVTAAALLAAIAGLFELVRRMLAPSPTAARCAWLAVSLWVFALPFLRWSIQVRTDQFGVAFGLWGAVALLATRRPTWSAALAGACFGAGFLFTQKVLYVALLGAIVRTSRGPSVRDAVACGAVFALTVAGFRELLSLFFTLPGLQPLGSGLRAFDDYRRTFGFQLQRGLLAATLPQLAAIGLLAAATVRSLRARSSQRQEWTAWALVIAGFAVSAFHSAAFPYFWLTLGLFFAVALGSCRDLLLETLPQRVRGLTVASWGLGLLVPAVLYSARLLDDTQRAQREALRFAARELAPPRQGFQLEGALLCRGQSDSFPVYFRPHIEAAFAEPGAAAKIEAFLERFRSKPVVFLIESHMIGFFPPPITKFWQENYQPYYGPVCLAGRSLDAGARVSWEVFVPGKYRWSALDAARAAELNVDGRPLRDGQTIELTRGLHELEARTAAGRLVYAVQTEPWFPAAQFYAYPPIREIIGGSYFAP